MPSNNFKIFDENKQNILSDEEYNTNTQRTNGVQAGIASSKLNNKFSYQVSLMAYALSQLMIENGIDALDSAEVNTFVDNLGSALLQKVVDKANKVLAEAGEDDTKWMTPLQAKNAIFTLATKAPNILADSTKEIFGLDQSATVNDVFVVLGLGAGKYGYGITLKYPDGTPAAGLKVTGVTDRLGQEITTDENGYFLAVSTATSITFSVNQGYFDINNITNKKVQSTSVVTSQDVSFEYKTFNNYVLLTSSQQLKFSRSYKLDLTAVGGGGGGAGGASQSSYGDFGGGGGGGRVETVLDKQIAKDQSLKIDIGAGGSLGSFTGTSEQKYYGGTGGTTQVFILEGMQLLVSATGGNGGNGSHRNSNTSLNTASGNGTGGGYTYQGAPTYSGTPHPGTAGTGFIFNDQSLGLAGGGGGGCSNINNYNNPMSGGAPHGAQGGYARGSFDYVAATSPGVGGGGGGGGSNSNGVARGSVGGFGGVYLRLKSA